MFKRSDSSFTAGPLVHVVGAEQTGLNIVMRLGEAEAGDEECSLARFLLSSDYVVELGSELMSTTH